MTAWNRASRLQAGMYILPFEKSNEANNCTQGQGKLGISEMHVSVLILHCLHAALKPYRQAGNVLSEVFQRIW